MSKVLKVFLIVVCIILIIFVIFNLGYYFGKNSKGNEVELKESKEERVQKIEEKVKYLNEFSIGGMKNEEVGVEILGNIVEDYLEHFSTKTVSVSIFKSKNKIEIVPAPDPLRTQTFYYQEDGSLMMYLTKSNTIELEIRYYFENNKLIETKISSDIDYQIEMPEEKEEDILIKAKNVYEKYLKIENIKKEIDEIVFQSDIISSKKQKEDMVGTEILGETVKGFMESFEVEQVNVNVEIIGDSVRIIPLPDFLNNQYFYYDKNGALVLYITESNGIGGRGKYYFYGEELIEIVNEMEENAELPNEEVNDILNKSKNVYEKYMKQ